MAFPLVLRRTFDELAKDKENSEWFLNKQIDQMEEKLAGLTIRINAGEIYRENLAGRNEALLEDNRQLHEKLEQLKAQLKETERKLREVTMVKEAMEACWERKKGEVDGSDKPVS